MKKGWNDKKRDEVFIYKVVSSFVSVICLVLVFLSGV